MKSTWYAVCIVFSTNDLFRYYFFYKGYRSRFRILFVTWTCVASSFTLTFNELYFYYIVFECTIWNDSDMIGVRMVVITKVNNFAPIPNM